MIIDTYTHVWESPDQLGRSYEHLQASAAGTPRTSTADAPLGKDYQVPSASSSTHYEACERTDRAIVLGFKSHYLQAEIPDGYVSEYVSEHPQKLVGFSTVDPSRPTEALEDVEKGYSQLGLKGVAIAPAAQDFHPASSNAYLIYERIAELNLPLLIHHGVYFSTRSKLEYARPAMLDEIAREFPKMKIIVAHMGYPWVDECVVLLEKHLNVYADVSGLLTQTWRAFSALLTAYQYGVIDKLLFGSGFPFHSAVDCIESLYSINQICQGTSLPIIPREQLRGIVERPTLELLGISEPGPVTDLPSAAGLGAPLIDDDEPG